MHFYIFWTLLFQIIMKYLHTSFKHHFKTISYNLQHISLCKTDMHEKYTLGHGI